MPLYPQSPSFHRIITRHPGAVEWLHRQLKPGTVTETLPHLAIEAVEGGGCYYGIFPLNLAATICERGSACWGIAVELPPALRGQELSAEQLEQLGARLVRYDVRPFTAD